MARIPSGSRIAIKESAVHTYVMDSDMIKFKKYTDKGIFPQGYLIGYYGGIAEVVWDEQYYHSDMYSVEPDSEHKLLEFDIDLDYSDRKWNIALKWIEAIPNESAVNSLTKEERIKLKVLAKINKTYRTSKLSFVRNWVKEAS